MALHIKCLQYNVIKNAMTDKKITHALFKRWLVLLAIFIPYATFYN